MGIRSEEFVYKLFHSFGKKEITRLNHKEDSLTDKADSGIDDKLDDSNETQCMAQDGDGMQLCEAPSPFSDIQSQGNAVLAYLTQEVRGFVCSEPRTRIQASMAVSSLGNDPSVIKCAFLHVGWKSGLDLKEFDHPGDMLPWDINGGIPPAQVQSYREYMDQTWPPGGSLILTAVEKMLLYGSSGKCSLLLRRAPDVRTKSNTRSTTDHSISKILRTTHLIVSAYAFSVSKRNLV